MMTCDSFIFTRFSCDSLLFPAEILTIHLFSRDFHVIHLFGINMAFINYHVIRFSRNSCVIHLFSHLIFSRFIHFHKRFSCDSFIFIRDFSHRSDESFFTSRECLFIFHAITHYPHDVMCFTCHLRLHISCVITCEMHVI